MDNYSALKKRIQPSQVLKYAALLCSILAVILLMISFSTKEDKLLKYFNDDLTGKGDYVYLDVIGVSDWVCKYDGGTYYLVLDEEGWYNNVHLTDKQFNSMKAQYDWYISTDDDLPAPNPVRIYGTVYNCNDEVRRLFLESFDISNSEYYDYFGDYIFDQTITPGENEKAMWQLFAFFAGLFALLFFSIYASQNRVFKKSLEILERDLETDKVASELFFYADNSNEKDVVTKSYIISKTGHFIVRIKDIAWVYERNIRSYGISTGNYMILNTPECEGMQLDIRKKTEFAADLLQKIREANPNVLLGFTSQNKKEYKKLKLK